MVDIQYIQWLFQCTQKLIKENARLIKILFMAKLIFDVKLSICIYNEI